MPIAAVMPSGRMAPARVRALLDLIARTPDVVPAAPRVPHSRRRSDVAAKSRRGAA